MTMRGDMLGGHGQQDGLPKDGRPEACPAVWDGLLGREHAVSRSGPRAPASALYIQQ